jgi:hypothetical protein
MFLALMVGAPRSPGGPNNVLFDRLRAPRSSGGAIVDILQLSGSRSQSSGNTSQGAL